MIDPNIPHEVIKMAMNDKIIELSITYGLEPADVMRLLSDWGTWMNENLSWQFVNKN